MPSRGQESLRVDITKAEAKRFRRWVEMGRAAGFAGFSWCSALRAGADQLRRDLLDYCEATGITLEELADRVEQEQRAKAGKAKGSTFTGPENVSPRVDGLDG